MSSEIRCHVTGTLPPFPAQQNQHMHRLVASLYMLTGQTDVTLINEPVEISTVAGQRAQDFDVLVAFQGLDSAAVQHPLLEATSTGGVDTSPNLCIVLQLLSINQEERQHVTMFGGVSIDTQGLALGGEVRGTILLYTCATESNYSNLILRQVLESQADRMVRDRVLFQQSMHVKTYVTASHRKTTKENNEHNTVISRSLTNTWDRLGRNRACITVEVWEGLTIDEDPTTAPTPYDVSVALVNRQERIIPHAMMDALRCSPALGAIHLPTVWFPLPSGTHPESVWRHRLFTAGDVISTSAVDSSIQVTVSKGDEVIAHVVVPFRDWRGFDVEGLTSATIFDCDIDGPVPMSLRLSSQLFSDKIPASPAFTCLANCCGIATRFPPGGSDQMIVDVLSHDGLIVSNFDEIEPFTNTLLDGAIALIRAYPEDTEVCLLAFGFLMRVIAASYVTGTIQKDNQDNQETTAGSRGGLETTVKKWLNLHFEVPNLGVKLLRLIASAVDTCGVSVGLGKGTLGGDLGGEMMDHFWPPLLSEPSNKSAQTIVSLTWVPLVKLAFRSHQCTSNGDTNNTTSIGVMISGVSKLLHSTAGWASSTIISSPSPLPPPPGSMAGVADMGAQTGAQMGAQTATRDIAAQVHAVFQVVLEHQTNVLSIVGPLEGFFNGFLSSNKGSNSNTPATTLPAASVFEALKSFHRALDIPAVQQAISSNHTTTELSKARLESLVHTFTSIIIALFRQSKSKSKSKTKTTDDFRSNALIQAIAALINVTCLARNGDSSPSLWSSSSALVSSLISVLRTISLHKSIRNMGLKNAVTMLLCVACEVFDLQSWSALRDQCLEDDASGNGFVHMCGMLGGGTTIAYSTVQTHSSLTRVGKGFVDLLQVMLLSSSTSSTSCSSSLHRAAVKLAPSVQETLRTAVNAQATTTNIVETLPAITSALLLRHARDHMANNDTTTSSPSVLMSYEMLWIESLVTLLGDVDAFVNETAFECLALRLQNIVQIMEKVAVTSPSSLASLGKVLDTLPRRVASRLHRLCTTKKKQIATSNIWWFKPWRVYHHMCGCLTGDITRVAILANAMDRVAQVCLLYAQLWDSQPNVDSTCSLVASKDQHTFTILLALGRMLHELKMIREAAACMSSASSWYLGDSTGMDTTIDQSFQFGFAMCQASSSYLLYTASSRDVQTASVGMNVAFNAFLRANDVQRATDCLQRLQQWNTKANGTGTIDLEALEAQLKQQKQQLQLQQPLSKVGPWSFLVVFNGHGFRSYDPRLESGASFVYTLYAPGSYHTNKSAEDSTRTQQRSLALASSLQLYLEEIYFVFSEFEGADSISVHPAVDLFGGTRESERYVTLQVNENVAATTHVYEVSDPMVPFMSRLSVKAVESCGNMSNVARMALWTKRAEESPCLPSSWSCMDWSQSLCTPEPMLLMGSSNIETAPSKTSSSFDDGWGNNDWGPPLTKTIVPSKLRQSTQELDTKQDDVATKIDRTTMHKEAVTTKRTLAKPKSKPKTIVPKKKTNLAALRKNRAKQKKQQQETAAAAKKKRAQKKKSIPPPPPPSDDVEEEEEGEEEDTRFSGLADGAEVPAWLMGMQASLGSNTNGGDSGGDGGGGGGGGGAGGGGGVPSEPPRRTSLKVTSQETKDALAYARSVGAFMSPDDAIFLKNAVTADRKVILECVVTTDKGGKDATVEITPDVVKIFTRGMFSKKTLYKFEVSKALKVNEAPTPKLLMLIAPELNGEMLYINCDKRGVFKGAVAAFVKEQDVVVADTGGGGGSGDGWGPSGW